MCVILYTNLKDKIVLAKNRDRAYKPHIRIHHKIVNGIEIAYINDLQSGWIEGMNEHGTAIINSTLNRNDGSANPNTKRKPKGNKIYNTLCETDENKILNHLLSKDNDLYIIEGHTFLYVNNVCYHIENSIENEYVITKAKMNDVYTNHGVLLPEEGYTKGKKAISSFLRRKIMENEAKKNTFKSYDDIATSMNKNYVNVDPRFHTYRDRSTSKKFIHDKSNKTRYISTTGQLIMNVTDKELIFYSDKNNSEDVKYINELPKGYTAKIRVDIKETEKQLKKKYKIFTQKYLKGKYQKYKYVSKHGTKKNSSKKNRSKKNRTKKNRSKKNRTKKNRSRKNR